MFKLVNYITTTNMHLFNADGVSYKKYAEPEAILEDYCKTRIEFYNKRSVYVERFRNKSFKNK